ncbi:hypothetical protein P700755_003540 [Psychroflexus torquis ATCC 700755]|uniref:Uncharacterized protein n=1 Tax=Psychroflexus torquis (strain ATCC 700755 / CIP 106069 / ACAM 623) TaxID=313595 RepID=K4IK18_PSYTT|nr:hypothetical protein [Psychroflexus torquis]AFU70153.1 hypothetical protein P700755_003540 [Psychroflexus torquis ATCC 700755]
MIEKIRNLTLNKRIIFFVIALALWFVIIKMLIGNDTGHQQQINTETILIVSGFFITGLYVVFFRNIKKTDK